MEFCVDRPTVFNRQVRLGVPALPILMSGSVSCLLTFTWYIERTTANNQPHDNECPLRSASLVQQASSAGSFTGFAALLRCSILRS